MQSLHFIGLHAICKTYSDHIDVGLMRCLEFIAELCVLTILADCVRSHHRSNNRPCPSELLLGPYDHLRTLYYAQSRTNWVAVIHALHRRTADSAVTLYITMSALFRNRFKPGDDAGRNTSAVQSVTASGDVQVSDGDLKYVGQRGGNNAPVGYQEASGAPVEVNSPLGYGVGPVTIIFLNLSKMASCKVSSCQADFC